MDRDKCKVAVLIPCYNEAVSIAKVVRDFRTSLPEAAIYVYDNNSTDNTAELAKAAGAIVRHEPRQGKGAVMRSMFSQIDADYYVIVDGDDTYQASAAPDMLNIAISTGADIVVADRLSSTYFTRNKRPFHNSGNRLVRSMINSLFHVHLNDIMSGYRVLSRDFVKNMPVMTNGFEIETEMTIHALDKNYKIVEVPVEYRDRPENSHSKLNTFSDGFKVIRIIFSLLRSYRPMLFFSILSVLSLVVAMLLIVPVLVEYWKTGLVPRFPSLIAGCTFLMLSILLFVAGMILSGIADNQRRIHELLRIHQLNRNTYNNE